MAGVIMVGALHICWDLDRPLAGTGYPMPFTFLA